MMTAGAERTRSVRRPGRGLPRWAEGIIGAALLILGLVLVLQPFASIGLLLTLLGIAPIAFGIAELLRRGESAARLRWLRQTAAVILIVLGIAVLLLPGLTLRWAVILLGIALLVQGVRELATLGGETTRVRRWAQLCSGIATILFGVLALVWRDVTVLVVGALFGIWLLVQGARRLTDAVLRRRRQRVEETEQAERPVRGDRSWPQLVIGAASLALALLLSIVGGRLLGSPEPDAFYAAPSELPSEPGVLLRAEPYTATVPEGARGWRILYTTTRDKGIPAIASGFVMLPDGVERPPTIAWAHGTTGAAVGCAPTLLDQSTPGGQMPEMDRVLRQGWAVVATDYVGLGADAPHPYLVGEAEGRSVLDAVRASRQLQNASFGEQVVVWGHSQGGGAALWTGGLAASYAPELDVVGVAAMAPAANLPAMIGKLADGKAGTVVGPLVLAGYSAHYDDVRVGDYLRPEATLLYEETVARCWPDRSFIVSVLEAGVIDRPIWKQSPNEGPLAARLAANVPQRPIGAPLLIAQGLTDTLVLPEAQQQYVDARCAAGQQVDYRTYPGKDHMGVVSEGSPLLPQLMQWTEERLRGEPATNTC